MDDHAGVLNNEFHRACRDAGLIHFHLILAELYVDFGGSRGFFVVGAAAANERECGKSDHCGHPNSGLSVHDGPPFLLQGPLLSIEFPKPVDFLIFGSASSLSARQFWLGCFNRVLEGAEAKYQFPPSPIGW
jgi:hypothetical protein